MKYVIVNDPLNTKEIPRGLDRTLAALNWGQSKLIDLMANPKFWQFVEPPAQRIDVLDLSNTFDLGLKAEFKHGHLSGWERIAVF